MARRLHDDHPSASASLEEGLDETLTVKSLGLPSQLERILSTTNAIENLMGGVRTHTRRVKKWKDGKIMLRWVGVSLEDSSTRFRRVMNAQGIRNLARTLRGETVAQKSEAA